MRINRSPLVASGVVATAVLGAAAIGVALSPVAAKSHAATIPANPGWRVVAKIGPFNGQVSGTLSAETPTGAWSVWTGPKFTAVERWNGSAWKQVAVPAALTAYVRSAVAFDGTANDLWLFNSHRPGEVVRYADGIWSLLPIPSWVLRTAHGGGYQVTAVAPSPTDVWVFSLGAGAYAAHYNGRAWAKVALPAAPLRVDADSAGDIWALGADFLMHWTPAAGWRTVKFPPPLPLPAGTLSYQDVAAAGPDDAWLVATFTPRTGSGDSWFTWHWNGRSWAYHGGPTSFVGSVAADGHGGLWADGLNANPGGFWQLDHLAGSKWTTVTLPAGVWTQSPLTLTRIWGGSSLWATAQGISDKGTKALVLKDGR
jgi:hypothetical protein